ncbi:SDR family oxidoreductase [Planctomycetota bacterium]|nr:SDR family oxidoreductase [Planctomycetota bacterium]
MKVLITGHQGYIGCHAVDIFQRAGHFVTGVDIGYFADCTFTKRPRVDAELTTDVADLTPRDVAGHDVVVHLAAISNDSMGELDEDLTANTNVTATMHLADICKTAKVPRLLFSSSCAVYGDSHGAHADESFATAPQTAYARSKIAAEQQLLEIGDNDFSVCILRNATAYGHSPALRTDLVFNDFVARLATENKVHLLSNGGAHRPLIHCRDIARAFLCCAEAGQEVISGQIMNVGDDNQNIKVIALARMICAKRDNSSLIFADTAGADQRDYLVNFSKLHQVLPTFSVNYSLSAEAEYLLDSCRKQPNLANELLAGRYSRLQQLQNKLGL